jgi:hypothetical protein
LVPGALVEPEELAPKAGFEAVVVGDSAGRLAATVAAEASAADSDVAEEHSVRPKEAEQAESRLAVGWAAETEESAPKARLAAVDSAGPLVAAAAAEVSVSAADSVAAEERFVLVA